MPEWRSVSLHLCSPMLYCANPTCNSLVGLLTILLLLVNCRFEHPGSNPNPFGAPASNANRFGALSNFGGGGTGGGTGGTGGAGGAGGTGGGANQYKVTKESIKIDLADERPPWILSCYGPGKDAPEQLFGGYPREQSIEEVRLYVTSSANPQQAVRPPFISPLIWPYDGLSCLIRLLTGLAYSSYPKYKAYTDKPNSRSKRRSITWTALSNSY